MVPSSASSTDSAPSTLGRQHVSDPAQREASAVLPCLLFGTQNLHPDAQHTGHSTIGELQAAQTPHHASRLLSSTVGQTNPRKRKTHARHLSLTSRISSHQAHIRGPFCLLYHRVTMRSLSSHSGAGCCALPIRSCKAYVHNLPEASPTQYASVGPHTPG